MACMALNILVGHTGLVSFGHGAWFGLGAYVAALLQREVSAAVDSVSDPAGAPCLDRAYCVIFGYLILGGAASTSPSDHGAVRHALCRGLPLDRGDRRRRTVGRYHPARRCRAFRLETNATYYGLVAAIAFIVVYLLWRFHRSPV